MPPYRRLHAVTKGSLATAKPMDWSHPGRRGPGGSDVAGMDAWSVGDTTPPAHRPGLAGVDVVVRPRLLLAAIAAAALVPGAGSAVAAPLPPIELTDAGADAQRRPFARWRPDHPIVNLRVSTRPVRDPGTQPADRYLAQAGFYDRAAHGPAPFWRGEGDPLLPGVYHTAIQGDGPGQGGAPWTQFRSFRVKPRRGEWTGPTSQKRYLRFTRTRAGALRGVAFSVYARGCGTYASLRLPGSVPLRADGRFSARGTGRSKRYVGAAKVRISGRVRRGFARGTLRVDDLFEGCGSGYVRWSARRR